MGSQYEKEKLGKMLAHERFNAVHLVQFECPRQWKPPLSSNFEVGRFPFSGYWTSGVIRLGSQYEGEKLRKILAPVLQKGLIHCIWSSLYVPENGSPLSHPILKLDDFPFLIIGPLG